MAGLYLHIPFCKKACHYCDFHFSTQVDVTQKFCDALARELALQKDYLDGETLETIYFGGGTPSLLSKKELTQIFESIRAHFTIAANPEITLEANPDDLTPEKLSWLKKIGVNRLSIGVQSLDSQVLQFLNRSHDASQALKSIESARTEGFSNISVDLIYAIPGRKSAQLQRDLEQLLELAPEHISAYSLTIEEKTVFGSRAARGQLTPETETENAHQFELVMDSLAGAGFVHYEISNYAKPGFQSRHNSSYWKQKKYLGVGPSAHSFNGSTRQVNIANNPTYIKSLLASEIPATIETLTREDRINEYIMTSLRTNYGCDLNYLMTVHQFNLEEAQRVYLETAIKTELLVVENKIIKLTKRGKMLADKIAADLFEIADA